MVSTLWHTATLLALHSAGRSTFASVLPPSSRDLSIVSADALAWSVAEIYKPVSTSSEVLATWNPIAVCFGVGDVHATLRLSSLRLYISACRGVCALAATLHATTSHLGTPGSAMASANTTLNCTASALPGWTDVPLDGMGNTLQANTSYCLSLSLSPIRPHGTGTGGTGALQQGGNCTLSIAHARRAQSYVSAYPFTIGPLLTASSTLPATGWIPRGPQASPDYGLPALQLRIVAQAGQPGGTLLPVSQWNQSVLLPTRAGALLPSPSRAPALPLVRPVVAPVGIPATQGMAGQQGQGAYSDVYLGSNEGLLACFVYLDSRKAVRPYRVRFIPLAQRPEDASLLSLPTSTGWQAPRNATILVSTARIYVKGRSATYRVITRSTRTIPLPSTDNEAQEISVDAQNGVVDGPATAAAGGGDTVWADTMNGGDGWCVAVGPVDGQALRVAHSTAPAGMWGPSTCVSRAFNCYGVADFRGNPPTRMERIGQAPWLAVDVIDTAPRPTPAASPSSAAARVVAQVRLLLFGFSCDVYSLEKLRGSEAVQALRGAIAGAVGLPAPHVIINAAVCRSDPVLTAPSSARVPDIDALGETTQVVSYGGSDGANQDQDQEEEEEGQQEGDVQGIGQTLGARRAQAVGLLQTQTLELRLQVRTLPGQSALPTLLPSSAVWVGVLGAQGQAIDSQGKSTDETVLARLAALLDVSSAAGTSLLFPPLRSLCLELNASATIPVNAPPAGLAGMVLHASVQAGPGPGGQGGQGGITWTPGVIAGATIGILLLLLCAVVLGVQRARGRLACSRRTPVLTKHAPPLSVVPSAGRLRPQGSAQEAQVDV